MEDEYKPMMTDEEFNKSINEELQRVVRKFATDVIAECDAKINSLIDACPADASEEQATMTMAAVLAELACATHRMKTGE